MSGIYSRRISAVEKRMAADGMAQADVEADAATFSAAIIAIADRFADDDSAIGDIERRIEFSAAQRLAWALRFGTPEQFDQALDEAREMAA